MLTVMLGLVGAVVWGCADFLGGLAARRLHPVTVTAMTAVIGIVPLLVALAVVPSVASTPALVLGLLGGLSGTLGVVLLYGALAVGPMSVLSPVTAVVSAVVPVSVGLLRGVTLTPLGIMALVVAVVAVALVAAVRDDSGARLTARGLVTAIGAGAAFGGLVLAFAATPADSGIAPLIVSRALQAILMGSTALALSAAARRRAARPPHPALPAPTGGAADPGTRGSAAGSAAPPGRRLVRIVVTCGLLDAMANICVQTGLHSSSDPSVLPVMSVLNALYPIGTVILATIVLHERLTAVQAGGIVLAFVASVGLALG